jgi:hypothetical protein
VNESVIRLGPATRESVFAESRKLAKNAIVGADGQNIQKGEKHTFLGG